MFVKTPYLLNLWLGVVPDYTVNFLELSLLTSLLYAVSSCVTTAIQATGKIKMFQIGVCFIMLSELPIAWFLMTKGFPPYAVIWPSLVTYTIAVFFRFLLIQRYVEGYRFSDYMRCVIMPCLLVFVIAYALSHFSCMSFETNFLNLIISVIICVVISAIVIFMIGMSKSERVFAISKVRNWLSNKI